MRILNVAAFAISGYSSTDGRHCKPFNPLLGETYEADYPDKGVHFFSEKVSLQPKFLYVDIYVLVNQLILLTALLGIYVYIFLYIVTYCYKLASACTYFFIQHVQFKQKTKKKKQFISFMDTTAIGLGFSHHNGCQLGCSSFCSRRTRTFGALEIPCANWGPIDSIVLLAIRLPP